MNDAQRHPIMTNCDVQMRIAVEKTDSRFMLRKSLSRKKAAYPPLTSANLPYPRQPLTEGRLAELFAFCASEYEKRHGRAWRFAGGKLIHSNGFILREGYYILISPSPGDPISLSTDVPAGTTRAALARFLLDVINNADDLKLTIK